MKPIGSANYSEYIVMMDPSDMQDEINRLAINGIPLSMIDGHVGIVCPHVRMYDYKNNQIIMRFIPS